MDENLNQGEAPNTGPRYCKQLVIMHPLAPQVYKSVTPQPPFKLQVIEPGSDAALDFERYKQAKSRLKELK